MPLTRETVTIATRVTLPAYTLFGVYVGVIYVTDPGGRLQGSPAFPVLPVWLWGAGYLLSGLLIASALWRQRRRQAVMALASLLLWCAFWSACLWWSAIFDGTSFSAPAFPMLIAALVWASMLTVLARETTRR